MLNVSLLDGPLEQFVRCLWNLEGLSKDNVDESENVILLEDVTSRFCNNFYSKSFSELNTKQLP